MAIWSMPDVLMPEDDAVSKSCAQGICQNAQFINLHRDGYILRNTPACFCLQNYVRLIDAGDIKGAITLARGIYTVDLNDAQNPYLHPNQTPDYQEALQRNRRAYVVNDLERYLLPALKQSLRLRRLP